MPDTTQTDAPGKSKGMIGLIVAVLLLAAVGGGGGYAIGHHAVETIRNDAKAEERAQRPEIVADYTGTRRVVALPPVVTNLAKPNQIWVRVEASALYDEAEGGLSEALVAELSADIRDYLATLSVAHLEGASGLLYLKHELTERARIRSAERVKELLITSLIVE